MPWSPLKKYSQLWRKKDKRKRQRKLTRRQVEDALIEAAEAGIDPAEALNRIVEEKLIDDDVMLEMQTHLAVIRESVYERREIEVD